MKLIFNKEKKRFECLSTYEERLIPKDVNFYWDGNSKRWWHTKPEFAIKLREYASPECEAYFNLILEEKKEKVEESHLNNSNITILAPEGLEYLPFQKAGIEFISKRNNVLLADEMGLGKTIIALGYINLNPNLKHILIICPASLKLNWKREAEKWLINKLSIDVVNSIETKLDSSNIVIINYDILKKFHKELRKIEWDLLVCDEVHKIKSWKALRTKEVIGGKGIPPLKAKKKLFLTGTPILNHPIEIWTSVHFLAPKEFDNFWHFTRQYCNAQQTKYGMDLSGTNNLEELNERLRASVMLRRLKADVLPELPPKRRQIIELNMNGFSSLIKKEQEIWERETNKVEKLRKELEKLQAEKENELYKEQVKKLRNAKFAAFTEISRIRHETAVAKVPLVIEFIEDLFEEDENKKLVVFAHHHDVINLISERFKDCCVVLTGETSIQNRQEAVDRFQNDLKAKLFVGSITAAGVGITLTASSHVIFAELDWVPANIFQCEDRCHRIGTVESVLIQHLVFDGSIDANIAKKLLVKQEMIEKALGDVKKDDIMEDII